MSKISIIIPVYNAESTLDKTLDSLLSQTHKNLEIICVDDGSKDSSFEILKHYSAKFPNKVKAIHQENQGVSVARNTGISAATGKILMFVDADDELVPYACERVNEVFQKENVEVFTFGFKCEPKEAMPLGMNKELKPPAKTYIGFHPDLLFKDKARPYICRTAVSKYLLQRESIQFQPGVKLGEDQIIYFLIYPTSKKTILSPEQLYIYNMNHESATHSNAANDKGALQRLDEHLLVIGTIMQEWSSRGFSSLCQSELLDWMLDFVMFDISNLPDYKKYQYYSNLISTFSNYFKKSPSEATNNRITKKCLVDIETTLKVNRISQGNHDNNYIKFVHLGLFYLMRYGFVRCIQQVLISLGILRKWK